MLTNVRSTLLWGLSQEKKAESQIGPNPRLSYTLETMRSEYAPGVPWIEDPTQSLKWDIRLVHLAIYSLN